MEERAVKEITLDDAQLQAVNLCTDTSHRLAAVTGPAGSGKTTIIKQVYDALTQAGTSVALAAPTGKAARRIKEATGIDAVTVHKLLEYGRPGERDSETGKPLDPTLPKRTRRDPLIEEVIIVDEYAMIPYELHNNLIAALPSGGCLRAFGDIYQLPPIEPYAIVDSRKMPEPTPFEKLLKRDGDSIKLEHVYRQGEGSQILSAGDRIRRGVTPPINQDLGEFYVKMTDQPIQLLKQYIKYHGDAFKSINHQVITPGVKSWVGTHQLNIIMREMLNPNPRGEVSLPRHVWDKLDVTVGLGDKVVCTENTYDLRDYFERYAVWNRFDEPDPASYIPTPESKQMLNGETGVITMIYPDGGMDVDFGDRIVEIPAKHSEYWEKKNTVIEVSALRSINLAYALTTHKCQGSEYESVVYVLNKSTQYNQSRQNFYTAITRARNKALVLTDQMSLRISVQRVKR